MNMLWHGGNNSLVKEKAIMNIVWTSHCWDTSRSRHTHRHLIRLCCTPRVFLALLSKVITSRPFYFASKATRFTSFLMVHTHFQQTFTIIHCHKKNRQNESKTPESVSPQAVSGSDQANKGSNYEENFRDKANNSGSGRENELVQQWLDCLFQLRPGICHC